MALFQQAGRAGSGDGKFHRAGRCGRRGLHLFHAWSSRLLVSRGADRIRWGQIPLRGPDPEETPLVDGRLHSLGRLPGRNPAMVSPIMAGTLQHPGSGRLDRAGSRQDRSRRPARCHRGDHPADPVLSREPDLHDRNASGEILQSGDGRGAGMVPRAPRSRAGKETSRAGSRRGGSAGCRAPDQTHRDHPTAQKDSRRPRRGRRRRRG